ncbi:MAG: glycosyltransferase [Coriobacteriia bacterium]
MQLCPQQEPPDYRTTIHNTVFLDDTSLRHYSRLKGLGKGLGRYRERGRSGAEAAVSNIVRQRSAYGRLRSTASGYLDLAGCRLSPQLVRLVEEFRPSVIYTAGSSIRVLGVVDRLARALGIPVVLHLMDDWPRTAYRSSILSMLPRLALLRALRRVNKVTCSNFAISEPLCAKYQKKYHREYRPLMNPATRIAEGLTTEDGQPVEFLYAGSITLGRQDSLRIIAQAVLGAKGAQEAACMSMYIPDPQKTEEVVTEFSSLGCEVHGYLPSEELRDRLVHAGVLVHVESFEPGFAEFAALSLSTKIPEYMGAGKPILAFLPATQYGSTYIEEHGCGVVVTEAVQVSEAVARLIDDAPLREMLARRGLKVAASEHAMDIVRQRLTETLQAASAARATAGGGPVVVP